MVRDRFLAALPATGHGQQAASEVPGGFLLTGVSVATIDDFLRDFENDPESLLSAKDLVRPYIAERYGDELARWDVLITSLKPSSVRQPGKIGGWDIVPLQRAIGPADLRHGRLTISGSSARVASRGMEKSGLTVDQVVGAEDDYRKEIGAPHGSNLNFPDRVYRARRERPLFILFNIAIKDKDVSPEDLEKLPAGSVVGWGISFPISSKPGKTVEYILNTTKLRELFGDDDSDEGTGEEDV